MTTFDDNEHQRNKSGGAHQRSSGRNGARRRAPNPLNGIFEDGRKAIGYVDAGTKDNIRRTPKPAAASGALSLDDLVFLGNPAPAGIYSINLADITESAPLDPRKVIHDYSACANAGARIIVAAPRDNLLLVTGQKTNGLTGFYRDVGLIRTVDPAPFSTVADGADVTISPWPLFDTPLSWGDAPTSAFATSITRTQNLAVGGGEVLRDALLISILRGLGKLADQVLLGAIVAANPAAFSFGAAAAKAFRFEQLHGFIGTAGDGAAVNAAGELVAGPGVKAELTAACAATIIGAFDRSAIAIWPELTIHANRTSADGTVVLSCFANIQAAVPDPASFWSVVS